jgi:hypothetical protein
MPSIQADHPEPVIGKDLYRDKNVELRKGGKDPAEAQRSRSFFDLEIRKTRKESQNRELPQTSHDHESANTFDLFSFLSS